MYGRNPPMEGSQSDPPPDWNSPGAGTGLEESMWQLGLGSRDSYPERPGEPDCSYFMRTGFCGYGVRCRYNHPRDRNTVVGAARYGGGEYPERVGQPACQGEKECSYYMKTGQCKFGATCKFHHPQPANTSMPAPAPAPAFYPTVQSPSVLSSQQYGGVTTNWQVARPALLPGSYVQGPYGTVLLHQGVVPVPGLAPVSPAASPGTQPTVGAGPLYGVAQLSPSASAFAGPYPSLPSSAGPSSSSQRERIFPERPGQPECQYYMRTGDCKFGSTCRYHHPPDWITPNTDCVLSPMGLPLRLGAPPCTFYAQHGVCKYGPTCKFDHPMGTLSYSPSASSLADMPVAPYPIGSSMATLAPSSSSSDLRSEFILGSNKDSFSARMPSSENTSSGSVGSIFSTSAPVPRSNVQLSGQSSARLSSSSTTGQGDELGSSS
ncbi:hypothetical protein HHK36_022908 [Tetracentron sinense]|uniref:C3H1-type domain-containing protein n=1 Tax=Tetracentron sinense TaxID=13715 RepID=A0A835D6R9_TETSI|nr:hypothetical protein HHK36_022908 [Tetracentron sinense]